MTTNKPHDEVTAPDHYNWHPSGVECKTICQEFNYNLGNAMKYIWRCNHKHDDPRKDIRKAIENLENELRRLDGIYT